MESQHDRPAEPEKNKRPPNFPRNFRTDNMVKRLFTKGFGSDEQEEQTKENDQKGDTVKE